MAKKNKEVNLLLEEKAKRYSEKIKAGERLDFEDFKFLIEIHMEFPFFYQNKMYEIVWSEDGLEFYKEQNKDYSSSVYELYPTGDDFLVNARIENKTLKEIFKDLIF